MRRLTRCAALAGLMAAISSLAMAQPVDPKATLDALDQAFGGHQPGARAVHAKGLVVEGTFVPSPAAAGVSRAPHFQAGPTPVTIRFSNFAGIPTQADGDAMASPRGMALKFHLADGTDTDIVAHSVNGFPVATAADFLAMVQAAAAHDLPTFLASHPGARAFEALPKPIPASYATLGYFAVNAFRFTNAQGRATLGRYRLVPEVGQTLLTPAEAAGRPADYLAAEMARRLAQGPARFRLMLQVAETGDRVDDATVAWPETRRQVDLGTLTLTGIASDQDFQQRTLLFLPGRLPAGIEPADPMVDARTPIYGASFRRRLGEDG
ncbi:catalase family peroxidase [Nitrospirillum sp. BR 11163]|uniref:catalase family peroxidase n=1 Tax=Nitrospirillum sp. BR 11163 TaxID=3104323 RepID=UPI002AFE0116|nr:catalase family peroxidase [Nitrospirillum sp. BR 11163]MEA1677069.1 catalase family peroxidase [Nitrospirillum sp. BR 11163]